jgi:hypothetical protein
VCIFLIKLWYSTGITLLRLRELIITRYHLIDKKEKGTTKISFKLIEKSNKIILS